VLESGAFESRQRVLVAEPVVEASEAGARTLGVTYWQTVDGLTRGGVRASWTGDGGKLKLLGGPTLLTFGPAEFSFDSGLVSCRHTIKGGLLALRAGGSVTLAQRPEGDQQELSVTVEGYLPRLAARADAPPLDRHALREGAEPVPCRNRPPLLRTPATEPRFVKITVFGATGVGGQALLPMLAEHELTAVSRTAREEPNIRYVVADAASGDGVAAALEGAKVVYCLVNSLGGRDFEKQDRSAAETVSREAANAGVRQIVYLGGLGADDPDASPQLQSRRETGERLGSAGVPVTTLRAAMIVGKGSAAFETILALVKRLPVMVTPSWVSTPTQPSALDDIARYLRQRGHLRRGLRHRWVRGDDLPADDRANRCPARPQTNNRRSPGADAAPLLAVAQPRHACERISRTAACRRTAQPNRRARGTDPQTATAPAHPVRRSSAESTRISSDKGCGGCRAATPVATRTT
jgi:uncharacterized protein YbjT (DUF2867 family)